MSPVLFKLDHHFGNLDEVAVGLHIGFLVHDLTDAVQVGVVAFIVTFQFIGKALSRY